MAGDVSGTKDDRMIGRSFFRRSRGCRSGLALLFTVFLLLEAVPSVAADDEPFARRMWIPSDGEVAAGTNQAARPGVVEVGLPTPTALAVRWPIAGDRNGDATVRVAFRVAGTEPWQDALPLFWSDPDKLPTWRRPPTGRLFAGSILGLTPGTRYELRLALADPDGGTETRTITLGTSREPTLPPAMRARHVVPAGGDAGGGSGTVGDPYRGLRAASEKAAPGDLLLLGPGAYEVGNLRIARAGEPGQPIVLRGGEAGSVVLDGGGSAALIDISRLDHIWLEGITFRNARVLVEAEHAHHIVIRHNRFLIPDEFEAIGLRSENANDGDATGFFITDNEFIGPNPWRKAVTESRELRVPRAIAVTGSGHVIAHNLIRNVGDAIHNGDNGTLSASDIHHNDINVATDDCIEIDYSVTNVRVHHNRLTNCFTGISAQPALGGPHYVYRNMIANTRYTPFKLHNETAGLLLLHNSSLRSGIPFWILTSGETVNDVVTRNNVFVGSGSPALASTGSMRRTDFDNDAYSWGSGGFALWNRREYASPLSARESGNLYARYGAIALPPGSPFANSLKPPADFDIGLDPAVNDLRPVVSSRLLDRGVRLSTINDNFDGAAPDIGCCEAGEPLPAFGPRPRRADD
jgi:hypothetical protein